MIIYVVSMEGTPIAVFDNETAVVKLLINEIIMCEGDTVFVDEELEKPSTIEEAEGLCEGFGLEYFVEAFELNGGV